MDLNADLGEGGPCDRELLAVVTSASIACGYHAGDHETMIGTARLAVAGGVAIGAHPSYPDRDGFGRRPMILPAEELLAVITDQVEAMAASARAAGGRLSYIKPHGALYNQAAVEPAVADTVVSAAGAVGLPLLGPPGSQLQRAAVLSAVPYFSEAFADRAYAADRSLLSRREAGSVIDDPAEVARRAVRLARHGEVPTVDGGVIEVVADSICIHGDTPGAAGLARSVRRALEDAGVALRPFAAP